MANNTILPPGGGGDTIADEDIAGVKYQQIKLVDSIAGSTTPIGTVANPLNTSLPASQIMTLTPPAAITGFALESGHLATIDTSTARIPPQGQALSAASMPVVLPAAQITTLTPPAAITGFALESGHLANIDTNTPTLGQKVSSGSQPVVIASDQVVPISVSSLPTPLGVALETGNIATLTQLVDQNKQIIKLLGAILMTLGNNGRGFVDPEEASELSSLQ